jgi:LPXTG-motif cell wall-anchored protein
VFATYIKESIMIKKSAGLFFAVSLILIICSCAPTTIDTLPQGAAVYRGETQVGTTPFHSRVWLTEKNFFVRKDRYFDEPVMLNYDSPEDIILKLRAVPVLVYSAPDAEIYPAGSDTPIGTTPMKVSVSDKEKTYTLKLKDYYDQDIKLSVDAADPTVVKMARRPIVTISAEPAGVEIHENGTLIGTAPIREEILAPRTFELRKAGYFTQTGTLTGAPPYEVTFKLKAFPVITVTAVPSGAQISRAGGLIGKGSVQLSVGGKTELEVRADRYYMQTVTLNPESPAQVNVALKAMPYVMINSQPAGAEVFIGGKSVGVTPVEHLIEKDTVVELRKEGFIAKTATLTGADKQVAVTLEAVPVVQPEVQAEAAAPEVAAPVEKKGPNLLLIAGIAVAVIAGLILFLLKRKKRE